MGETGVPYADKNWNVITGCSPEFSCWAHCWARRMAARLAGRHGYPTSDKGFTPGTFHEDRLNEPFTWKTPQMVLPNFMGDMFHRAVKTEHIDRQVAVMVDTPQHTYRILTKRAERMADYFTDPAARFRVQQYTTKTISEAEWPPANIQYGTSASTQLDVDERVRHLLRIDGFRWLSLEPLLESVEVGPYVDPTGYCCGGEPEFCHCLDDHPRDRDGLLATLDLVVAGCESGPGRRHTPDDVFRSVRDQCRNAGVPFSLKQMDVGGEVVTHPELDGRQWMEIPHQQRG